MWFLDRACRQKTKRKVLKASGTFVIEWCRLCSSCTSWFNLLPPQGLVKRLLKGVQTGRPVEVQTALLRRHMLELTQSFMIPLERYVASLMPLQKNICPYKVRTWIPRLVSLTWLWPSRKVCSHKVSTYSIDFLAFPEQLFVLYLNFSHVLMLHVLPEEQVFIQLLLFYYLRIWTRFLSVWKCASMEVRRSSVMVVKKEGYRNLYPDLWRSP